MVPTVVPDYMTIAMEEKARIRDNMPSIILNLVFEAQASSTADDDASSSRDDAQVSFRNSFSNTLLSLYGKTRAFLYGIEMCRSISLPTQDRAILSVSEQ